MTSNEESVLKNMISYTFTVYDLTYLYVEFTLDKLPDISKQFTFHRLTFVFISCDSQSLQS